MSPFLFFLRGASKMHNDLEAPAGKISSLDEKDALSICQGGAVRKVLLHPQVGWRGRWTTRQHIE